ncbi:MAG TPA: polyphosphate polymerase domain-containing protein [Bacteroidia bacterium]|nr:polyphosphate polymerase domain-containing protein [Bacteroidia bacterium]
MENVLQTFDSISLQEMDRVMLFDRYDQKFLLRGSMLADLLQFLTADYFVLEVKKTRIHTYHTLYFDTQDFQHYLNHHNQRKSRYKFRHRIYVESDLHFFEIKEKNNKERTVKSRVQVKDKQASLGQASLQLIDEIAGCDGSKMEAKLWTNFHRITLVHKYKQERMTIDMNMVVEDRTNMAEAKNLVILELKQEKKTLGVPLVRKLVEQGFRPGAMSKYVYGVTQLYPENKHNLFLPTQRTITKIKNAS